MSEELWLPIAGWEGSYEVSNQGRVKSYKTSQPRVLKNQRDKNGRQHVTLRRAGTQITALIHILVLEAFVGPRPEGQCGLHWDDDRSNNSVENLRWGTRADNAADLVRNGNHGQARKTHCPSGHPLSGSNLRLSSTGGRHCRQCNNDRAKLARQRKRMNP